MIIDIQAPNIPLNSVLVLAQDLANALNLSVTHDGHGRLIFHAKDDVEGFTNPLVSVPAQAELPVKTAQALRKVRMAAPKGAVLATDGARIAILRHSTKDWKEIKV